MKPEDAEEYTQALGQVVAGGWRQIALGHRLGVPKALKLSTDEWVKQRLGGYVKYSITERTQAIRTLKDDGFTWEEIKGALGTGNDQIGKALVTPGGSKKQGKSGVKPASSTPSGSDPLEVITGLAATNDVRQQIETKDARARREDAREQERQANAAKVAHVTDPRELLKIGRFSTIVIDPPWDFDDEGDENHMGRGKQNYAAKPLDDILTLPVNLLAATDCHLYLCITNRSLPKGFCLIEAWGFRYVTCLTWVKPSFGIGNYFRGQTEQILFGVKGSQALKRQDVGTVFEAPRGARHSEKPAALFALIESCSPGPFLEMFARTTRPGWTGWGEDSTHADA